jgi:hypothetical protein
MLYQHMSDYQALERSRNFYNTYWYVLSYCTNNNNNEKEKETEGKKMKKQKKREQRRRGGLKRDLTRK